MASLLHRIGINTIFILIVFLSSSTSHSSEKRSNTITNYEIKSDTVQIKTSNGIISGIVYKPIGVTKKLPGVLCLQGGGDVGLTNYIYEAKFFAKNGLVALVCDKSGSGLSKTIKSWRAQCFEDKTKEYHELFSWLANQSYVNPKKVGVHGMSEGGRLAINMAIAFPNDIAFVNAVSGPIESFKKNRLFAIRHYLLARSVDSLLVDEVVNLWSSYFDDVSQGEIMQSTINKINNFRKHNSSITFLPSNSKQLPSRPLSQDIHFSLENKLDDIECPVLFQYGELDILVNSKKSIRLIPKKSNFEIKHYVETDHSMNLSNNNIHPNYISDKKTWIYTVLK